MPQSTFLPSGDLLADRRYLLADSLLAEGDVEAAADLLRQALELAPGWAAALMLLGAAEERCGRREAAIEAYGLAAANDLRGTLGASLHVARLQARETVPEMPKAYVAALFDAYAPRFEQHLVEGLAYRGPALLRDALDEACGPSRFGPALDLGCGTGLMGSAIRNRVEVLDGVDLSPRMIDEARRTGLYRDLMAGDAQTFLAASPAGAYDLVLAADVFVYLGALDGILREVARVLRPGGVLGFTAQAGGTAEISLGEDLRFAHSPDYLARTIAKAGLTLTTQRPVSTRRERGLDVPGLVVLATKH